MIHPSLAPPGGFSQKRAQGIRKQENHRCASNTATLLNAERALSEVELSKRATRFSDVAYLSKRQLVPGTEATSGNLMSMSIVLIF